MMSVMTMQSFPEGSQESMAFPSSLFGSPFQSLGMRSLWASRGLGRCLTTMSRTTS